MIIEVNGVKMDVDLREAKTVETYKVGDPVKVLVKQYDSWEACPGVIVGFANFANRPGIEILYLNNRYGSAEVKLALYTADSKDMEICPMSDYEEAFDRAMVLEKLDGEIQKAKGAIRLLETKRNAFDKFFNG